jgi:hypothetical protein
MVGENEVALSNPLDAGNNANSVESAASGFDRIFGDVEPTEANREPREPKPKAKRSDPPEGDGRDPAHEDDDGQGPSDPSDLLDDPILDGSADPDPDDEEDEKDPDAEDDDEDEGDEFDREFDVTVAGKVEKVPLKELISGYSREADYRRKTASLAEERREVEEFAVETVEQRRTHDAAIVEWQERLKALEPSQEDWDAIEKSDPATALQLRKQWEGLGKLSEAAKAERQRLADQEAALQQREYVKYVRSEDQKLFEAVPALANPKRAQEFRATVLSYGEKAGYSKEELLAGAVDHRAVITLYKAARFDQIQAARKGTGKKGGAPKPNPGNSRPRNISRANGAGNERQVRDAEKRLARSGSVEDAALMFTNLIR